MNYALLVIVSLLAAIILVFLAIMLLKWVSFGASGRNQWPGFSMFIVVLVALGIGVLLGSNPVFGPTLSQATWGNLGLGNHVVPFPEDGVDFSFDAATSTLKILKTPTHTRWVIRFAPDGAKMYLTKKEVKIPSGTSPKEVEVWLEDPNGYTSSSVPIQM
jgi:hypothetical protein